MNQKNQVLKISTAGSVDDGKSTLIGRILYDTHSLTEDKIEAIEKSSRSKGFDYFDFSMATDGLTAEREQGITIDVAHIYFATPKRSYIIADTPGHIEYTRNMVTGASNADVSLILIDARNGVLEQTKRHFFISNLLRITKIIVAVNKMDLVNYESEVYQKIIDDFELLRQKGKNKNQMVRYIPVSALQGENILRKSDKMPWYKGNSLLEYLENTDLEGIEENTPARFQVQTVIRPRTEAFHDYRAYAGKLKSGQLSVGDEVMVLPSKKESRIKEIRFFNQCYQKASSGSSISIRLEDDIQVSRGDLLIKKNENIHESKSVKATLCWMDENALKPSSIYLMQFGVNRIKTKVKKIDYQLDINKPENQKPATELKMNDLGTVELQLAQILHYDRFQENKANGAFILIDLKNNNTAGVGFLE
ncbi:MAG: GTP-binding protein [Weeksellaceae bacterium]|nr:GTP-binding protein [Weeksellaceae bacterium]